jgi:hypothetical protein
MEKIKAPGIGYRKRKRGPDVPYWIADSDAVKAGYPVKAVNLLVFADQPELLRRRCTRLQAEMLMWLGGNRTHRVAFDGTFGTLIDRYLSDPESSFARLKPASRHPYSIYASKLKRHIGARRIDACDGRDVNKWFKVWAGDVDNFKSPEAKIPAARMALTVLKSAVLFGIICRLTGCVAFKEILSALEFPGNKRRSFAPTAADIEKARSAAHAVRAPRRALSYALQFETTLRQWDVIGQWIPLNDPRPSAIIERGEKWIGPTWAHIDENLVLRLVHGKTDDTSEAAGSYDLSVCPMVVAELAGIPEEKRRGPLIISEHTGLPYRYDNFKEAWKTDFKRAGLPAKMWNRDLRAGGITEGGIAEASIEDRRKVAGHTTTRLTATIYDRDQLEAHRRVARARSGHRSKNDGRT